MARRFGSFEGFTPVVIGAFVVLVSTGCRRRAPTDGTVTAEPATSTAQPNSPQSSNMAREQEFIEALRKPMSQSESAAFVKRNVDEARSTARAAVALWASGSKDQAYNAFSYLVDIDDLAVVPLLEKPFRDDPKAASQALDVLVDAELTLRRKLIARVNQLLDDKRPVPPPAAAAVAEEPYHPHRVCDEAYVAMRRLVHFGEPRLAHELGATQFYAAAEPKRDIEIAYARSTNTWRRTVNPDDDVEDDGPHSPMR